MDFNNIELNNQIEWFEPLHLDYYKEQTNKLNGLDYTNKEKIINDLTIFFEERFDLSNLKQHFENVFNKLKYSNYMMLEKNDLSLNLNKIIKNKFETFELREENYELIEIINDIPNLIPNIRNYKGYCWKEWQSIFKDEFKDFEFKNINKTINFNGFELPAAGNGGFNERMEFKELEYLDKEQNIKYIDEIFCNTSVYILNLIELEQYLKLIELLNNINNKDILQKEDLNNIVNKILELKNLNNLDLFN